MLPNLIIAGAPKCGTTSLYFQLNQHPEIYLSEPKEPRIFTVNWKENDNHFFYHFFPNYNGEKIIGEASGSYFSNPEVPERIFQLNPNAKLIFIFRNPLEQVLSFYWLRARNGRELREWAVALKSPPSDPLFQYSFYFKNLSRFAKVFPPESIHVVILEEFLKNPKNELHEIFSFLEIDPHVKIQEDLWVNKGTASRNLLLSYLIKNLRESVMMNKLPGYLKPVLKSFRQILESVNRKKMDKGIKEEEAIYLQNLFFEDVKNLEQHLGKSLPWGI